MSIKKATPPPPRPQHAQRERQGGRTEFRGNGRNFNSAPRSNNFSREPRPAAAAPQAAGPADFEARLKQFMQQSDSKLSDLRMTEKRSSRRSGHR